MAKHVSHHRAAHVFRGRGIRSGVFGWPGWVLFASLLGRSAGAFQSQVILPDAPRDARVLRTDAQLDAPLDVYRHRVPDYLGCLMGNWAPFNPSQDLFSGTYPPNAQGDFLRIDLRFRGLMNPPGDLASTNYEPFAYGPNPICGFFEIDMDNNTSTGGELLQPELRYLGVIARFGGYPAIPRFFLRVATELSDLKRPFKEPPFTKRHGEEFHLALFGDEFTKEDIVPLVGNGDLFFEEGETWRITSTFLHRAHGFEEFTLSQGCGPSGSYLPITWLQFEHNRTNDLTTVSVVFPMTNAAAARITGGEVEDLNHIACDQASIQEALWSLQDSAKFLLRFPTGKPEEEIIINWATQEPNHYLVVARWWVTACFGTPYLQYTPDSLSLAFTDVFPNVVKGDVTGDGVVDRLDELMIQEYINRVGGGKPVVIEDFALDFRLLDVNYDGVVSTLDVKNRPRQGDGDGDEDVDLADFSLFLECFAKDVNAWPKCVVFDFDDDSRITLIDHAKFTEEFLGPAGF